MKLILSYAEADEFRDMFRRPEWCCMLHTRLQKLLDHCASWEPRVPNYAAIAFTPQEINEFRGMLQRPEWCCALHTKMLDFLDREDVKAHLDMEAKCLAAYDAGDRTTLREVIEELANVSGR